MSSKGKNSGKGKKSKGEAKGEDILQAVILADSFQSRFKPLTLDRPRCLLPLANVPLIEYTLEFLAMNFVQEVYIYCGNHVDQVEDYISKSRWANQSITTPFTNITFVPFPDARSTGDILRDLDKRGFIDTDFILVHGDVVSNFSLDSVLAAHKARRVENSDNIMTIVLREAGPTQHRTQSPAITPIFTVDSKTGRCLTYDEMTCNDEEHVILMDNELLDDLSTDYEVRADLIDPEIDICTPDVLALWSESFDYELPRKHFLQGVLKDYELNGKAIYTTILNDGYAARARNMPMYNAISADIMGRWTFPFVPDCNIFPGQKYEVDFRSANVVQCGRQGAQINATSKVTRSVIADNTTVGPDATVTSSIIGRNCVIGKGAVIQDSHIWDGSIIEDGAVVIRSIVAGRGAKVGTSCTVNEGSVVSFGAVIGPNSVVPQDTRIALEKYCDSAISSDEIVGTESNAAVYEDPEEEDLDSNDTALLLKTLVYRPRALSIQSISTIHSHTDSTESEFSRPGGELHRSDSFTSDFSDNGDSGFHGDAVQGLLDTLRGESDFDAAKLEFMGLRLSQNASDTSVRKAIATAYVLRTAEFIDEESLDTKKAVQRVLSSRPGALRFIADVGIAGSTMADQRGFIFALQKATSAMKTLDDDKAGVLLSCFIHQLYDLDVVEEDSILAWWNDEESEAEEVNGVREKCKEFVEWLQDAEEEDSDEEESEEEESGEESDDE